MHGTIFAELQKYADARLGAGGWQKLKEASGIARDAYDPFEIYPDAEVSALVSTASRVTGIEMQALLEDFGEFIAPDLLEMYWALISPQWKTLDVIEHTESTIHDVVRLNQKGATPPYLKAERTSPDEVTILYTSPRRLCSVAKGIVRGIGKHYGEPIRIEDRRCMLRGDADCMMIVRREA